MQEIKLAVISVDYIINEYKMNKYLLSNGYSTDKIEVYILDLFRVYLLTNYNDIPHSNIGFDFTFTDVKKNELRSVLEARITRLVNIFSKSYPNYKISVDDITLISETRVKLTVSINKIKETYEISTGLY